MNNYDHIELSKLKNKKILITGGTGLIGSHFVKELLSLNERYALNINLLLVVRSLAKARMMFRDYPNIDYVVQDVSNPFDDDLGKVDYCLLAACSAYPAAYKSSPVDVMNANYLGANNILEYFVRTKQNPIKVIFVSSSEVYGEYECDNNGVDETFEGLINHLTIRSCYTEGKRAAETLCLSYASQYGLNISLARPGYIFGPTWNTNNNRADVEFFNSVKNKQPIVLKSPGSQRRSYCYAEDAVKALIYILLNGKASEAYNIALNPEDSITIKEFASMIAKAGNVDLIQSSLDKDSGWSPFSKAILNNKKLRDLGWIPEYSVQKGIEKTIKQMNIDARC